VLAGRLEEVTGMDPFENHCWQDVISSDTLELYKHYKRETYVGPAPALVAIDLYELAYQGGNLPVADVSKTYPSSCGEYAHAAIPPTQKLFAAARLAGIPIFYSTSETRNDAEAGAITATNRKGVPRDPSVYEIRAEFAPHPTDAIIRKMRASAFYGTPLLAQLVRLGVRSVIMCGESTSGCVRASAVDAYSNGFHVTLVEECCFDRHLLSHKVNLFDLHHKYADVMACDDVARHLSSVTAQKAR
jgi:nicotinamidase-related amidase